MRSHDPDRRRLLAGLAAAGLLTACGRRAEPSAAPGPAVPPSAAPPEGTAGPVDRTRAPEPAVPPAPAPYVPLPGEVFGDAKALAADVAVALATYAAGESPDEVARRAAAGRGSADVDLGALRVAAAPLHTAGAASRATVDYPQLGGLAPLPDAGRPRAASVMVVLRQVLQPADGPEQVLVRTVDVWLRDPGDGWRLDRLGDAGGTPAPRPPRVGAAAAAVLDHPRITLPDSARWDVHRGEAEPSLKVDDRLLTLMAQLADVHPYRVTCLRSGHPRYVFDGDTSRGRRTSNHYAGRAVDIWSVADRPVVQQRDDVSSSAYGFVTLAAEAGGLAELGAPAARGTAAAGRWDLDGRSGSHPTFTNGVHDDHIHMGFGGRR